MHVAKMKQCTRVVAPKNTVTQDAFTGKAFPTDEVDAWLNYHGIWDGELIAEDDGDHGPLYVYYFAKPEDATLFTLRFS